MIIVCKRLLNCFNSFHVFLPSIYSRADNSTLIREWQDYLLERGHVRASLWLEHSPHPSHLHITKVAVFDINISTIMILGETFAETFMFFLNKKYFHLNIQCQGEKEYREKYPKKRNILEISNSLKFTFIEQFIIFCLEYYFPTQPKKNYNYILSTIFFFRIIDNCMLLK